MQRHADVDRLVVVDETDLGGLGRRLALERLRLDEARNRLAVPPGVVVQEPIDDWGFSNLDRRCNRSLLRPRRGKAAAEN